MSIEQCGHILMSYDPTDVKQHHPSYCYNFGEQGSVAEINKFLIF